MELSDRMYMERCIQLALLGAGWVAPNPMVGSVLVYQNRIIGEGWHTKFGKAHAEIECLNSVSVADLHLIKESTLYVSLEPCAHFGKTPPCADRIVQEGIQRVVIGSVDPFAKVNGAGISILKQAGIEVQVGICEEECSWLNRRFFLFHRDKRPYIHLKWAKSVDGFIAGNQKERTIISGTLSQRLVHKWRSEESSILIGTQTAISDNPALNNRYWSGPQPLRLVLDRYDKIPIDHLLMTDDLPVWIFSETLQKESGNKRWIKMDRSQDEVPEQICRILFQENIQSVLVEGGTKLLQSFINEGLWDEAHIITNTRLILSAGTKAPNLTKGFRKSEKDTGADLIEHFIHEHGNI